MTDQGYDLVGDIHGHANALYRLLRELDYCEVEGISRHPERQMVLFVISCGLSPRCTFVLRDLHLLDIVEIFGRIPHLVGVAQERSHEPADQLMNRAGRP